MQVGVGAGVRVTMFADDDTTNDVPSAATAVTTAADIMTIHYTIHAIKHDCMTANVGIIADESEICYKCM